MKSLDYANAKAPFWFLIVIIVSVAMYAYLIFIAYRANMLQRDNFERTVTVSSANEHTSTTQRRLEPSRKKNETNTTTKCKPFKRNLPKYTVRDKLLSKTNLYILEPKNVCSQNGTAVVIAVINSHYANVKQRQIVRRTWANQTMWDFTLGMDVFFVIGRPSDAARLTQIQHEARLFGDILQISDRENYYAMASKVMLAFKWLLERCDSNNKTFHYMMKTDDDMYIDINRLWSQIFSFSDNFYTIKCAYFAHDEAPRDMCSKWYITKEEWPQVYFPMFCRGSMYVMSHMILADLYLNALQTVHRAVWHEDVFITGLLTEGLNITFIDWNFMYVDLNPLDPLRRNFTNNTVFAHVPDNTYRERLWNQFASRSIII